MKLTENAFVGATAEVVSVLEQEVHYVQGRGPSGAYPIVISPTDAILSCNAKDARAPLKVSERPKRTREGGNKA